MLTARADRTDIWYDDQNGSDLPRSQENFFIEAQSIRENTRFKPFVWYEINHTSDVSGVYQQAHTGVSGPITDQLFLYADIGYYLSTTGNSGFLFDVDLRHEAGPYTTEELQLARQLNDFEDEVVNTGYYRITQVLGPTLYATAFANYVEFQELTNNDYVDSHQYDVGLRLNWILGPLTNLAVSGIYSHQSYNDGARDDVWTGRVDLYRQLEDNFFFRATYQYQRADARPSRENYFENVVYLSLSKFFY